MGQLENRVIIITGATSGMGRSMAYLFAAEGASIVINGRNEKHGKALQEELIALNPNVIFEPGDIGIPQTNMKLVEKAIEHFGKLDTIVANAGILGLGDVVNLPVASWQETINTNLSALFYLSKYAVPHMLRNNFGIILANASIAAFKAFPNHPAYCASKAGQVALVRQLASEYGPVIRANAMCPGPVDTPLIWESAVAFDHPEEAVANAANNTLMKRLGKPEDIAQLALFLISNHSSFITGATVNIDGGITVG